MALTLRLWVGDSVDIGTESFELIEVDGPNATLRSSSGYEVSLWLSHWETIKVDGHTVKILLYRTGREGGNALLKVSEKRHFLGFSRPQRSGEYSETSDSEPTWGDPCPNCGERIIHNHKGFCCQGCYEALNWPTDDE